MDALFASPAGRLALALAIGLIVGTERERHNRANSASVAGLRTFALVALLGGLSASSGSAVITALAGGIVGILTLLAFRQRAPQHAGLTSEVALAVTFILGWLALTQPVLAVSTGLAVTLLLTCRVQLHHLVRRSMTRRDMLDGLTFLAAALVVLPLAPDRTLDPWGLINPYHLWRLMVVLMGLSALGYIAQRAIGPRYGLTLAGFVSGFVSSTVGIAAMGTRARTDEKLATGAAAGAVAAVLGSLCYLVALVVATAPDLARILWAPLAGALVPTLIYALTMGWRAARTDPGPIAAGHAFDVRMAVVFTALVAVFAGVGRLLTATLGASGVIAGSAATGLVDAHATAVSLATLFAAHSVLASTASLAILVGLSVNMAAKVPVAFALGPPAFAWRVTVGLTLLIVGLWAGFALSYALPA